MTEVFIAFALGAASSGAAFFFADRTARKDRASLLDRLMARDLTEFKAFEPRPEQTAPKPTSEERRRMEEEARLADEAHGLV